MQARLIVIFAAILGTSVATAQTTDPVCPRVEQKSPGKKPQKPAKPLGDKTIEARADALTARDKSWVKIAGNVEIRQGQQTIRTEEAVIDDKQGRLQIDQPLTLTSEQMQVAGEKLSIDYFSGATDIQGAQYQINNPSARGDAGQLVTDGKQKLTLTDSSFTTCPVGDNGWIFEAGEIEIDQQQGMGTASNLVMKVKDIPVFYFPYLSFPITEQRVSGVLVPKVASSSEDGLSITVPYYFNIAPNYDDTLTTRYMTERGLHLSNEFRYLTDFGEGELQTEFLQDQEVKRLLREESELAALQGYDSENRYMASWQHKGLYDNGWLLKTDITEFSDDNYLSDLDSDLNLDYSRRIYKRIDVGYQTDWWEFHTLIEDDDVLSFDRQPFKRLPEFNLTSFIPEAIAGADWRIEGHWVNFKNKSIADAQRTHFETQLSDNFEAPWYFLRPSANMWYTHYKQEAFDQQLILDDNVDRLALGAALDLGIRFERPIEGGVQTLEPRLFYNRIKSKSHQGIGVYDTSLPTIHYQRLFSVNRFSGIDRINETNQLTLGLSTEWFAGSTRTANLQIGRIFRFADDTVSLNQGDEVLSGNSGYFVESEYQINDNWWLMAQTEIGSSQDKLLQSHFQIHYQDESGLLFDARHRMNRQYSEPLEQIEMSAAIPLSKDWKLVAHTRRDLELDRSVDAFMGVEYETCCWAVRLAYRRHLDAPLSITGDAIAGEDLYNNNFYLQFSFKGLSSIGGSGISELLSEKIYGFNDTFGN